MATPTIYGQVFTLCSIHLEVNNPNLFYCSHQSHPRDRIICAISYETLDKLLALHNQNHLFPDLLAFKTYLKTI